MLPIRFSHFLACVALAVLIGIAQCAEACPFCGPVPPTFGEEMLRMDVVVLAELIERKVKSELDPADEAAEKPDEEKTDAELARFGGSKSMFKIVEVIKGDELVEQGMEFSTVFFGEGRAGDRFLVMGIDPPDIAWTTPLAMKPDSVEYIKQIPELPEKGAQRLAFFNDFLESSNSLLAQDSYDEFAKAPYDEIIDLKPELDREKLLGWIEDIDVSPVRKRLYYTMLGVCGERSDSETIEKLMKSDDPLRRASMDAMVACYLTLTDGDGLPLVNEMFFSNPDSAYAETYAAISAIRFHATETDVLTRQEAIESFRILLDRKNVRDLVIADLARLEDWDVMERLVVLFKTGSKDSGWVRVPIINYLRLCPLPEAAAHLKELKELDPNAFKRAFIFSPLDDEDEDDEDEEGGDDEDKDEDKNDDSVEDEAKTEAALPDLNEGPTSSLQPSTIRQSAPWSLGANQANVTNGSNAAGQSGEVFDDTALDDTALDESVLDIMSGSESANQTQPSFVTNSGDSGSQVTDSRTRNALRPVIEAAEPSATEESTTTAGQIELAGQAEALVAARTADSSPVAPVVAAVPTHLTLLIGFMPLLLGAILFLFLWLVITGRVESIGI